MGGGYSLGYVLQYHDPNTTPSPNPNERKSWEYCHIEFLLIIHVTKMLLGIYVSLHSAGNLFSGLRPRNLILKVLQYSQLPSPPPLLIKNGMGRPLPKIHFIFPHFKFKVSIRVG